MAKKFLLLLICSMALFILPAAAESAENQVVNLVLDGQTVDTSSWEVQPFIQNGRTMIPLRSVTELTGAEVSWANDTAYVKNKEYNWTSVFVIGSDSCRIGLKGSFEMDVAPYILNGKTVIPVRYLTESLCISVDRDGDTNTVILSTELPGVDSPDSPEWRKKVTLMAFNNAFLLEIYLSDRENIEEFLFDLYTIKSNMAEGGSITFQNQEGAVVNISVSDNGQKISVSGNNRPGYYEINFTSMNVLLGYENYTGELGDKLAADLSLTIQAAIDAGEGETGNFSVSGENDNYTFTAREYTVLDEDTGESVIWRERTVVKKQV